MRPMAGHTFSGSHASPHIEPHVSLVPHAAPRPVPHIYVPHPEPAPIVRIYHPYPWWLFHRDPTPTPSSSAGDPSLGVYTDAPSTEPQLGWLVPVGAVLLMALFAYWFWRSSE